MLNYSHVVHKSPDTGFASSGNVKTQKISFLEFKKLLKKSGTVLKRAQKNILDVRYRCSQIADFFHFLFKVSNNQNVSAIQNAGLVIGMTLVAFEQPEADLNAMMPIYMALMTSAFTIPLMVTHYTVLKLFPGYRRICEENREAQEREKEAYNAKNSDSTRKVELDEVENDQKETLSSPA